VAAVSNPILPRNLPHYSDGTRSFSMNWQIEVARPGLLLSTLSHMDF
jgi:hypothetical protein